MYHQLYSKLEVRYVMRLGLKDARVSSLEEFLKAECVEVDLDLNSADFEWLVFQVFSLSEDAPDEVAGGDGTAGWILGELSDLTKLWGLYQVKFERHASLEEMLKELQSDLKYGLPTLIAVEADQVENLIRQLKDQDGGFAGKSVDLYGHRYDISWLKAAFFDLVNIVIVVEAKMWCQVVGQDPRSVFRCVAIIEVQPWGTALVRIF
ncbi:hypothetical protein Tco_0291882 [Tanacetum coccineum]